MDMKSGYNGVRYSFHYKTGAPLSDLSRSSRYPRVHLDVSIDFNIGSPPKVITLHSDLDSFTPLSWSVYPHEYIVAEKLHALISREGVSTRAKDIYDLSVLLPIIKNPAEVKLAVSYIFSSLETKVPDSLYDEISSYDTSVLEKVWKKIQFVNPVNFKKTWKLLLNELRKIDKKPPLK